MSSDTHASRWISLDDKGRAILAGTTIKVIEIALDLVANGWSPAEIHFQHDRRINLAQIHAALAYYYEHQADFDRLIEADRREASRRRTQAQAPALTQVGATPSNS